MRFSAVLAVLLVALLTACQKKEEPEAQAAAEPAPPAPVVVQEFLPLTTETVTWERRQPKCKGGQCASVTVDVVRFPGNPELSALIEQELVGLIQGPLNQGELTLDDYAAGFLARADKRSTANLTARLLRQTGALVVIRLDTNLYTGGAHGIPVTAFLNYDRHLNRRLLLDDVVQDGRRPALADLARKAHEVWLMENGFTDSAFAQQWPFVETDNFALGSQGLVLAYNVYALAPYSAGQPELLLPYAGLQGILRPEWIFASP